MIFLFLLLLGFVDGGGHLDRPWFRWRDGVIPFTFQQIDALDREVVKDTMALPPPASPPPDRAHRGLLLLLLLLLLSTLPLSWHGVWQGEVLLWPREGGEAERGDNQRV